MSRPENPSRAAAVAIIQRLRAAGHVAYLAGGCVRDRLLGLEPKDHDVATGAPPDAVKRLFRGARTVGEAFGVVLVPWAVGRQRVWVEVATFREDLGYSDGRRPDAVTFTDAEHDARRRDFTINGLFEDPLVEGPAAGMGGESCGIVDYVGGVADLRAGLIRAIGDPAQRFGEDYLRMLRAARFAARLDFGIERRTAAAIRAHADHLRGIARERIGQEIAWMLEGRNAARALQLVQSLGLDAHVLNEAHLAVDLTITRVAEAGVSARDAALVDAAVHGSSVSPAVPRLLAAWLIDRHVAPAIQTKRQGSGAPAGHHSANDVLASRLRAEAGTSVTCWRKALCLNNDHTEAIRGSMKLGVDLLNWPALSLAKRKRLLAGRHWPTTWSLATAMARGWSRSRRAGLADAGRAMTRLVREVRAAAPALIAEGVAPAPLVTGDDLIALGAQPGPAFARWLEGAYDAQLEGRLLSREQALRWLKKRLER